MARTGGSGGTRPRTRTAPTAPASTNGSSARSHGTAPGSTAGGNVGPESPMPLGKPISRSPTPARRDSVDRYGRNERRTMMTTMTEPTTKTLAVDGATLTYDIRTSDSPAPVLLVIGSPMGASGFGTLVGHFGDRTVVTYDPRGVERSITDDPGSESTPEQHADDVHRIIAELGVGPVDLFASSGGAVNALALVAAHPEDVRTLVAHEPPVASILPDRDYALAACRAVRDAYM